MTVGGARDPTQFALPGSCETLAWSLTAPASVDSCSTSSLHFGAGLACPDTCDVLTLRALRAGRAFVSSTAPTSDVPMVVLRAPRPNGSSRGAARLRESGRSLTGPADDALDVELGEPSPQRVDPVKGTCCHGPRRLPSCSDILSLRAWSACVRIWSVPREAWRTGSPYLHRSFASAKATAYLGLDAAVSRRVPWPRGQGPLRVVRAPGYVRPTSATQPTYLPAPALVALVLSVAAGVEPGGVTDRGTRRFTTSSPASTGSHAQDLGCSPRQLRGIEFLTTLSPARVGRPPSQTNRRATFEPRPPSRRAREGATRGDDPGSLPSAGRSGYRALRRSRSEALRLRMRLPERSWEGSDEQSSCRRERSGGHLAAPSEMFTLG